MTETRAGRLGDFEILGELGHGGMGVVYLARQLSLGRLVAVKMLPAELAGDEVALARFRREIRALARCDHPNIVRVLASGVFPDGRLYYAMEYVPGSDLELVWRELSGGAGAAETSRLGSSTWVSAVHQASRKKQDQTSQRSTAGAAPAVPLPLLPEPPPRPDEQGGYVRRIVALVRDAALALQAVHDRGLIHRDVKPANLMLTADGQRVVLMDFGLAKGQSLATAVSKGGGLLGTLRYAAPEQLASASLSVGPAADVRGLGVTLWELLTRRRLFAEADDEKQLAVMVHDQDVPRLRAMDPSFDRDLEAIVARATERRVADRIPSAALLAEYLQMYLDGRPLPIRIPGPAELLGRWVRLNRRLVATGVVAAAMIVVTALVAFIVIAQSRANALQLAKEKGHLAERNGQLAENLQRLAIEKGNLANTNKSLADRRQEALVREQQALVREQEQRILLEWRLYASQIEKIRRLAEEGNGAEARVLLNALPADKRSWEFDYLTTYLFGHQYTFRTEQPVDCVCFAPDGRYIAAGGGGFMSPVYVWDALAGREVQRLDPPRPQLLQHAQLHSLAYSPDGSLLLGVTDSRGVVWDLVSGRIVRLLGAPAETPKAAATGPGGTPLTAGLLGASPKLLKAGVFSPDGKIVAMADSEGVTRLWDVASGDEVGRMPAESVEIRCLAFCPDGKRLACGTDHGTGRVWDVRTCEPVNLLGGISLTVNGLPAVNALAWSPDGKVLLGACDLGVLKKWDAQSGKELRTLTIGRGVSYDVAFSSSGATFATSNSEGRVILWDAVREQARDVVLTDQGRPRHIAFSPGGTRLAIPGNGGVRVWELDGPGNSLNDAGHAVRGVALSQDGRLLAAAGGS